jgi:hypothetical protein
MSARWWWQNGHNGGDRTAAQQLRWRAFRARARPSAVVAEMGQLFAEIFYMQSYYSNLWYYLKIICAIIF